MELPTGLEPIRSCAATFNNRGKRRHGKPANYCKNCDKRTSSHKSKFCSSQCYWDFKHYHAYKNNDLNGIAFTSLRIIVLKNLPYECSSCKNTEWMGKPIELTVDHINGDPYDNDTSNLRLLCWNCHAQTPTFGAKNKGNGRRERYGAPN